MDQSGETFRIELVSLIDVTHENLGFGGVSQLRNTSSLFDLIDDPVVVADGFECDRGSFRKLGEKVLDSAGMVIDSGLLNR